MNAATNPPLDARPLELLNHDLPAALTLSDYDGEREFRYIKTSTAINIANFIFGFGGWSTQVLNLEPMRNSQDRILGYSATLRLTLHQNGVHYEDVGTCSLEDNSQDGRVPDHFNAHQIARKGAVSDALKRCLRHLGPMFGNDLYEDNRDRARAANAALDRLDALMGKSDAEEIVFGAQYHQTNEVPTRVSIQALFMEPGNVDSAQKSNHGAPPLDEPQGRGEPVTAAGHHSTTYEGRPD